MNDRQDKATGMVRVTVKLPPDQYDELFRHVHEIGSTMSAFFRECAAKAMKEDPPDAARGPAERQRS
jgi:hypothetical protein